MVSPRGVISFWPLYKLDIVQLSQTRVTFLCQSVLTCYMADESQAVTLRTTRKSQLYWPVVENSQWVCELFPLAGLRLYLFILSESYGKFILCPNYIGRWSKTPSEFYALFPLAGLRFTSYYPRATESSFYVHILSFYERGDDILFSNCIPWICDHSSL